MLSIFFCATLLNTFANVNCSLFASFVYFNMSCQVLGIESNKYEVPSKDSFNFSTSAVVCPNFFLKSSTETTNPAINPNKRKNLFELASLSNFFKVIPKASKAPTSS